MQVPAYHTVKQNPTLQELLNSAFPEPTFLLNIGHHNYILAIGKTDEFIYQPTAKGQFSSQFDDFISRTKGKYRFGFLSYELKNEFESGLKSRNNDTIEFPLAHFIVPEYVFIVQDGAGFYFGKNPVEIRDILKPRLDVEKSNSAIAIDGETSKEEYLANIAKIKTNIQDGLAYELNYCINFSGQGEIPSPEQLYKSLVEKTDAPFSAMLKLATHTVFSASPERFISRRGNKLTCQPIKGTLKRGTNPEEDKKLLSELASSEKDRSENIMIVDLVRNDLSKVSVAGSVVVENLNEVKSFKTVHQLVSTLTSELRPNVSESEVIQALFPMGSMTGAPKVSVMKFCDEIENFRRGLYSGAIGFIQPNGDFDFNVVIRTILHNTKTKRVSVAVGGAITMKSEAKKEYEECMTKLAALREVLEG